MLLREKKDAVVLDFFAGSGTTGHAVLEMNRNEKARRQFILCTNNENGICQEVCYPRLRNVIEGYKVKHRKIEGIEGNLKYFRTGFIKRTISRDTLRIRITQECTEMLCLRESIFGERKKTNDYRIFEQNGWIMAVYYSLEYRELRSLKKDLDKIRGQKILYCFSLDPLGLDKSDFEDWEGVSLEPIPQKILDIYETIHEF